ncbi:uncharacterized protein LOC144108208 [Amblyomma americanum]
MFPRKQTTDSEICLQITWTFPSTVHAAGKKAPSSPFRCDDPSLQAPFLPDRLPTAQFLPLMVVSGTAVVLLVEFRSPDASASEASYLAARCLRRFYLGGLTIGNVAFAIQMLTKAKRPHFIDSCRPAVFTPNGTEALVCPQVLTSKAPTGNPGAPLHAVDILRPRRFTKGNKRSRSGLKTWAHSLSTRRHHGISDVLLQIRDHIADDIRQPYHSGIDDLKDKAQRYCGPQDAEYSTEQVCHCFQVCF